MRGWWWRYLDVVVNVSTELSQAVLACLSRVLCLRPLTSFGWTSRETERLPRLGSWSIFSGRDPMPRGGVLCLAKQLRWATATACQPLYFLCLTPNFTDIHRYFLPLSSIPQFATLHTKTSSRKGEFHRFTLLHFKRGFPIRPLNPQLRKRWVILR